MGMWDGLKANQVGDGPPAPDAYTNGQWQAQSTLYRQMWEYFNRDIFDESLDKQENIKKYPLGVNMFETACVTHRASLFGEFGDDVLKFRVAAPKANNKDVQTVERSVDRMWTESGRNSLLLEAGLMSMILGGAVFRIWWNPYRRRLYFRLLQPDAWFPVWADDDYHDIMECYVSYLIDSATALRRYHVKVNDDRQATVQVYEHWTQKDYEVLVDDKPAYWDRAHQFPMAGDNPYRDPLTDQGILPFEYFPRDRAGSFYGIPLGKNLLRLQNEYNLRSADLGDATMEATHQYLFLRNSTRKTKGLKLTRGELISLGMTPPGQKDPDVFAISAGELPEAAVKWAAQLKTEGRTSVYTPAVAYGEDEGSQRSALTLAFRMWPLTQMTRTTRGFWTDSFYWLHRKAIIVAMSHPKNGYNLEKSHVNYRLVPLWSPMLPRDRAEEVNEMVVRKQTGLVSIQHAIEVLEERETEWIDEEVKRIEADQKREAELLMVMGNPMQQQQQQTVKPPSKVPSS